ncbi:MAG: MBL fold metallo-hydrolase [Lentisphaerae bacterium]|nr:MBL fold metallo-hydrolase [Lentisphaerota bacterium]
MTTITEIAPDVYRLSILNEAIGLQFNHFLIKDDEPLLYHTGLRSTFPELSAAVKRLMTPKDIRWIGWSHFESDECGALNEWLGAIPTAQAVCGALGAMVSVNDYASRPPRMLQDGESFTTGKRRFRYVATAHVPHGWDAGVLFEETDRTLLCSDLFTHFGTVEPLTSSDIVGRARESLENMQRSPFAYYIPYNARTSVVMGALADLKPALLATMHGSSFRGDCAQALRDLDGVLRDVLAR